MRGGLIVLLVFVLGGLIIYSAFVGTYNRLVQVNQQVNAAQAEAAMRNRRVAGGGRVGGAS